MPGATRCAYANRRAHLDPHTLDLVRDEAWFVRMLVESRVPEISPQLRPASNLSLANGARTEQITFTAFGVSIELTVPARIRGAALALLPPGASCPASGKRTATVTIAERNGMLEVSADGSLVGATDDAELALGVADAQIRARVALMAPDHVFVHAGVVAIHGRAVVMPGLTFAGKTTLVRALVQTGATYYSDEYAVLGTDGLVRPYAKALSIRSTDRAGRIAATPAASLGAITGTEPVRLGLAAITSYKPGAVLSPQPLNPGAAMLALLAHTIPARTRPGPAMAALKAALEGADAWQSDRGEAEETARMIIETFA